MLRFADPFNFYGTGTGTGRTNMLAGVYAAINALNGPSTANARAVLGSTTGRAHFRGAAFGGSGEACRRVFGATLSQLGVGAAFYYSGLPSANDVSFLFQPRDSANAAQCTLTVSSTGLLELRTGGRTGTVVADSGSPIITSGSYIHVEMYVDIHDTLGACEVRVNGVTVLDASNIDTKGTAITGADSIDLCKVHSGELITLDMSDLFIWDTTGGINDDFIGDKYALLLSPTSDGTLTDWVRNTGSNDFDAIDDAIQDGDTTYVTDTSTSGVSDYGLTDLPALTSDVVGIVTFAMLRKTDAGTCTVKSGLVETTASPDGVDYGADHPLTTSYAYYVDASDVSPSTGIHWTPTEVNAMQLRLARVA